MMSNLSIMYLTKFYDLLFSNLKSTKKIENDSIILTFMKSRKNTIYKILKQSTISGHNIPRNILQSLEDKLYIQSFEDFNSFIITSKGVWEIEKNRNVINEHLLISFLNDEYFTKTIKDDTLDDTEKVLLFSMILGRSFSKDSAVNLKNSDIIKDKWLEILDTAYTFLSDNHIIKEKKKKIFSGTKNVHLVSSMFRHNTDMMKKTLGIYDFTRNQEYFLNMYNKDYFEHDKLSHLFKKLFKGKLNNELIKATYILCNDISRNYSIYIYDTSSHQFRLPEYDLIIRDSLYQSLIL